MTWPTTSRSSRVIAGRPIEVTPIPPNEARTYLRQPAPTIRLRWVLLLVAFVWAVML